MNAPDLYAAVAPKPGSKKRRVLDRLLAANGDWVTATQLHQAFGVWGWSHDGAIAQLRAALRLLGGDIPGEPIPGRDEYRYRLVLPPESDHRAALAPHLERTEQQIEGLRRVVTGDGVRYEEIGAQGELF